MATSTTASTCTDPDCVACPAFLEGAWMLAAMVGQNYDDLDADEQDHYALIARKVSAVVMDTLAESVAPRALGSVGS